MKFKKMPPLKYIIIIAIVVSSVIISYRNFEETNQFKEDLIGSWYQPDDDSCALIEISDQELTRNYDITTIHIDENYRIKFINKNTLEIIPEYNEELKVKHTISFNEEKTEMTITPCINDYTDSSNSEIWYKGNPDSALLMEIVDNREKRQKKMEADKSAKELAERYDPKNCFGDLSVTNLDCYLGVKDLVASGTIYNNGANTIKNIEVKIFFNNRFGNEIIDWDMTICFFEDLDPGISKEFDGSRWFNRDVYGDEITFCSIKIIGYDVYENGTRKHVDLS